MLSLESKHYFPANCFNDLDKFKLKTPKEKMEKKQTNLFNTASKLHNNWIEIYFDECYDLSDAKRTKWVS